MKHPVDLHVGQRVRQRRWLFGMTQQQLAEKGGIKLARVVSLAEKVSGLLEVNLKDETAFEYFWLSSLRTWTTK